MDCAISNKHCCPRGTWEARGGRLPDSCINHCAHAYKCTKQCCRLTTRLHTRSRRSRRRQFRHAVSMHPPPLPVSPRAEPEGKAAWRISIQGGIRVIQLRKGGARHAPRPSYNEQAARGIRCARNTTGRRRAASVRSARHSMSRRRAACAAVRPAACLRRPRACWRTPPNCRARRTPIDSNPGVTLLRNPSDTFAQSRALLHSARGSPANTAGPSALQACITTDGANKQLKQPSGSGCAAPAPRRFN